jgi:imidazolonepropionase
VAATRAAALEQLVALARPRLEALAAGGVTTIEVKSGYGLEPASERRMLEAVRELDRDSRWELVPTFLGAHTVPAEFREDREGYLDRVVDEMLPDVVERGLARFCDVFCEPGLAFDAEESRRVLVRARELGLGVKIHADQLSAGGGAELAAALGAVSAEHLEHPSEAGIAAMARAGTVAALLPGADYFLGSAAHPPVQRFREAGVLMALATDMNPGSSPTTSLLLMASMACVRWKMTAPEALAGITAHAATALGLQGDRGRLAAGQRADLALFDVADHRDLVYWFGGHPTLGVVKDGREVWTR